MVFEPGVTAIVGPNGCGKSNVSDAVRWVLGEQRAKALRGAKMEEVIFQGSSARRAGNVAEVSLHFEDDEGSLDIPFREDGVAPARVIISSTAHPAACEISTTWFAARDSAPIPAW